MGTRHTIIAILLWAQVAGAASYYVATNGNNSADGSIGTPWRTIAKAITVAAAGDTVNIGQGDYGEQVNETTSGTAGNPIIFKANPARAASLTAFRLSGQYIVLDGLKLTKFSGAGNTWAAAVRIEPTSHNCIITNCAFSDMPASIGTDYSFSSADNSIHSASGDFVNAGFVPGSQVYLGACGLTNPLLYYVNHDTAWLVASNTATVMWVTNATSTTFSPDIGANYWAFIYPGIDANGFKAISFIVSGGSAATNVLVSGCLITNWAGNAMQFMGRGNIVENCTVTTLRSFRFMNYGGDNFIVRSNIVKYSPSVVFFTPAETTQLTHPAGSGWYDFAASMFAELTGISENTNNVFCWNWFEGLDNQLGTASDQGANTYGLTFNNNVFIGVTAQFSGGEDGMHWISNTFYRCAFDSSIPLAIGGHAPVQTNYVVTNNVFIDCSDYNPTNSSFGYYSVSSNATNPVVDWNMIAQSEITGYGGKATFSEAHGVNGGDPLFVDVLNPMGPDGLPFTADDGLHVLPTSPTTGGALGVYAVVNNQPVAHFRFIITNGWFEPIGTNYDPNWVGLLPTTRNRNIRPYTNAPSIGHAPLTAVFDGTGSISGVGGATTTNAIVKYAWAVNGTWKATNAFPRWTNTFSLTGNQLVTLGVTNTAGNWAFVTNLYKVDGAIYYVATNGSDSNDGKTIATAFLTWTKGVNSATNGDLVLIEPGVYDEKTTILRPGFTLRADGDVTNRSTIYMRSNNVTVDGFNLTGDGTNTVGNAVFYVNATDGTSNNWIINNKIHDTANAFANAGLISFTPSNGTNNSAYYVVSNNAFWNACGQAANFWGKGHLFINNFITNTYGSDLYWAQGSDHTFKHNFASQVGFGMCNVWGAGNPAFNGMYYDNAAVRFTKPEGYGIWTNTSGYTLTKYTAGYAGQGWSNVCNIVDIPTVHVYASAPALSGPWTMYDAVMVSPFTNGLGAVTHCDCIQCIGPLLNTSPATTNITATNITFVDNMFADGPVGAILTYSCYNTNYPGPVSDWTYSNNVWMNFEVAGTFQCPNTKFFNNTFYHCGFTNSVGAVLVFGMYNTNSMDSSGDYRGWSVFSQCKSNAFIGCGSSGASAGWYAVTAAGTNGTDSFTNVAAFPYPQYPYNTVLTNCDYNYVGDLFGGAKAATNVYPSPNAFKFYEPHGINGGGGGRTNYINPDGFNFRYAANSVLTNGDTRIGADLSFAPQAPAPPGSGTFSAGTIRAGRVSKP